MSRTFTAEQRAAIEDRRGSGLLAAAAGSGKTAVMVERFVEAVLRDGVAVGAILALTFTEKAAGELRERIRRRLVELGEEEHARAVDGAWVGTIHGFCARVLRAQPLAAGLDPRFAVLDEPEARRVAERAYDTALEAWAAAEGTAALDLAAAYGPGLRDLVLATHDTLRSRGAARPRLRVPPPRAAPDPSRLRAAREDALRCLRAAGDGARVRTGLDALAACGVALDGGGDVPWPGALDAAQLKGGAKALGESACEAYREAWIAYRDACADHHARAAVALLDTLLAHFGDAYAEAKAARAGLDFEDLELRARDLLADPERRSRWAERFALIMVDEFQDTNRLQLNLLQALERGNLFAVGDEFQSIYRFRHADVGIFRERRARLEAGRVRRLRANFRSSEALLDVLNSAFTGELGPAFEPLRAGLARNGDGPLRLFDPDAAPDPSGPPVELLITDTNGWEDESPGLTGLTDKPWRAAEARLVAHRLRAEVDAGRRPGDVVVLVRATASLRLFEEALEEQGLPTYVVGGRGYWSQEQVRDGLAWLATLANPRDEEALLAVLASPFCGARTDALVLLTEAGRREGGVWPALRRLAGGGVRDGSSPSGGHPLPEWTRALDPAERERLVRVARVLVAERAHAERLPADVLLERGIVATGYDLAVLARAGGDRRLANLRKLMRLAREHERAEGRDLRAFVAFAAGQDLSEAREGEAALESEGLDAVRLMTIHRAKGLEFPVVCVADLGRQGATSRPALLVGEDGEVGLRLAPVGGGESVPALAWRRLADAEAEAQAEEERRLFYVAMTRARERLILSGGVDAERWPEARPGDAPLLWIARALAGGGDPSALLRGGGAGVRCVLNTPATVDRATLGPRPGAAIDTEPERPLPDPPPPAPVPGRPPAAPRRLSYSSLQEYARCGYRFYLRRVLGLAPDRLPGPAPETEPGLPANVRGTIAHRLLEGLDFARPAPPADAAIHAAAAEQGATLAPADVDDLRALVAAVGALSLRPRLAHARRVRREAPFAFAAEPGTLITGYLDVLAEEDDGTVLVVDYKSDRLDDTDPEQAVERGYATQRLVYALAALRHGAPAVEVVYCFLERPQQPVTRRFTAADAPALNERLLGLAGGVLEERWTVTDHPHRELCADCPGRAALCSWPQSRTLAPAAS